jgi:ribosomal protein L1
MNKFESMPNITPGKKPETIEDMEKKAQGYKKYEEKVLSAPALAAHLLIEMGGKEKLKNITSTDIDEAFEKIKLSPIDYLNSDIAQIKKLIGKTDISKTDSAKIKELLKMSWASINNAIQLPSTNKQELVDYAIILDTVGLWMEEHNL